jgi:hypothetical protein
MRPYLKKPIIKKGQWIVPEFQLQYRKKKRKEKK